MVSFFRVALLTSLAALCLLQTGWAASSDNSWIVDTALPSLLRFNLNGEVVSSDLSEYIKFTCHGVGKDKTCEIDDSNTDLMDMNKLLQPSSSDSIQSYGTGVALYFFIAVLGAILVVLGTILYIIFFCGFDFFCVTSCCKRKAVFKKTGRQICAVTVLTAFFAFLVTVIVLCYTNGVSKAFDGVSETSDAPAGFATVAYSMGTALMPTYVAMLGNVLIPTLRVLNATVNDVVSYEAVVNDLEFLNATVGRLPNIKKMLQALNNIDQGVHDLSTDITGVMGDYYTYENTTAAVKVSTNLLLSDLRSVNASLVQISKDVTQGQETTQDLSDLCVTFFGSAGPGSYSSSDTDGLVDSTEHDFNMITRDDTPGHGFPEETTATDAAVGAVASMLRMKTLALNHNPTEIAALNTKLHGIYNSTRLLPNFNNTADNLVTLNDTVKATLASGGILDNMSTFLNALKTDLAGLPNTTLVAVHARELFDQVDDISTTSVYAHVLSMNATVATLPAQVNVLISEAEKISSLILSVLPPLYDLMVVQAEGFNRTIMKTPIDTRKLFDRVNKTVQRAAHSANEFLPQLRDLQSNFQDDLDVSSYLSLISDFQVKIDTNLASVNESAILAGIQSASVGSSFNVTAALEQVNSVGRVLSQVSIKQSAVNSLRQLEDFRFTLENSLQEKVALVGEASSRDVVATSDGDYWILGKGVCSLDSTVYCASNSDCTSGTCVDIGTYRCTSDGVAGNPITTCLHDSDCPGTTRCLNDDDRTTDLMNYLLALADPNSIPDMSDVSTQLQNMRASAASLDVAGQQSELAAVQVSIAKANTVPYEENLNELLTSITSTSSQFDDIIDEVKTSQDLLDKVDISEYTTQLEKVQDQLDKGADKLGEYMTLVKDMEKYIFSPSGLNSRFASLEPAQLQATMNERGFGQTLLYTGQVVEDTIQDVRDILKNNSFGVQSIEVTKSLKEPAHYMDRLTGNPHAGFVDLKTAGSLYYLLQMSNSSAKYQVDAHDPMQKLVTTDVNGDRYPDDKYCTTKYCFENQQDELESNYGVYLPLILIPLAVVCLIAIANVMCLFYPKDNRNGKLFCSRFLMCFIIVIVPWYLIFSGLIFAFTIAASDGCSSGPKIAANYVVAMGDDLCLKLDGTGTLTACRFTGNDVDVTMDLQAMTDAIIGTGSCGSSDSNSDPFYAPLHSLSSQLKNITTKNLEDVVYGKSLRRFRQPLKSIIIDSSEAGSTVMADFIDSIGYEVLTCDNLSSMLQSFKEPVCYTSVGAWAWLVSCAYLAAWCMCCMGIPAACALKNHYRLTILEEAEEVLNNKKGIAKEFATQHALATRRGRGVLARRFHNNKRSLYDDVDVEMSTMDTSSGGGNRGSSAAYNYQSVSQDEDDVRRAPVPTLVRDGVEDPAEVKSKGYFAKYPKVSSKQNVITGSNHSIGSANGNTSNGRGSEGSRGRVGSNGSYVPVATAESKQDDGASDASSDYGELQEPVGSVMQIDSYRSDV